MKRRPILLFAFPALILGILAGERMATFLLGVYSASPTMWWIWLELHPLATVFWQLVDVYLGGSMVLDSAIMVAALAACWLACGTRKQAPFFLANHLALLFAGLMVAASSHSETASTIAAFTAPSGLQFSLIVDLSWQNSVMLVLGLAACVYCHITFLTEARQRAEQRAMRLIALQRDI